MKLASQKSSDFGSLYCPGGMAADSRCPAVVWFRHTALNRCTFSQCTAQNAHFNPGCLIPPPFAVSALSCPCPLPQHTPRRSSGPAAPPTSGPTWRWPTPPAARPWISLCVCPPPPWVFTLLRTLHSAAIRINKKFAMYFFTKIFFSICRSLYRQN